MYISSLLQGMENLFVALVEEIKNIWKSWAIYYVKNTTLTIIRLNMWRMKMTQRVFDIENEKDMQDLWNIVDDLFKTENEE